jgi:hypothetical protein
MASGTWEDVVWLAGFLGRAQLEPMVEAARPKLGDKEIEGFWRDHGEARAYVQKLAPEKLSDAGEAPLSKQFAFREQDIRATEEFRQTYGERQVRFVTVKPDRLAAFQFQVRAGGRELSKDPSLVLDECLPTRFKLDADIEILGNQGTGAFQIAVSGDFMGNALLGPVRIDRARNTVELPFIPNRNWVQVAHFQGRYWLHNGYHRVYNLMGLGVDKIPCIVFEAEAPTEVVGPVYDLQGFAKLCMMPRPPLLKDFLSKASLKLPRRRHRHMLVANVQLGNEQVPI